MTKQLYFPAISTVLGVLVGGISWFVVYSTVYTPDIEFDGPAGLILGISMVVSGLIFGMVALSIYAHKNPKRRLVNALMLCIVSGMFVGISLGYVISKYEIQHTGQCVEEGLNNTCLD